MHEGWFPRARMSGRCGSRKRSEIYITHGVTLHWDCLIAVRLQRPRFTVVRCVQRRDSGTETRCSVEVPAEAMPDANAIPVIDLGPYLAGEPGALDHAAAELRYALTEIGFYTIVNHGVPSALVHRVDRQVARFHARPLDGSR